MDEKLRDIWNDLRAHSKMLSSRGRVTTTTTLPRWPLVNCWPTFKVVNSRSFSRNAKAARTILYVKLLMKYKAFPRYILFSVIQGGKVFLRYEIFWYCLLITWRATSLKAALSVHSFNTIERHWIPLNAIKHNWTPLDTIEHHWTLLNAMKHHRTVLNAI